MNNINYEFVNDLLKRIGYENVIVTPTPIFLWNGNTITDDETAQPKQIGMVEIPNNDLLKFIDKNKDKKIVICPHHDSDNVFNDKNLIKIYME